MTSVLHIFKAPSGQWAGKFLQDGLELGRVAGCESPEDVEDAAQDSGIVFDLVTVDAMFNLFSVRKDNGEKTLMTSSPVTYSEGLTLICKITEHDFRVLKLIEV